MAAKVEKPKVETEGTDTWAQVIKNSLGRDRLGDQKTYTPRPQRKHPRPQESEEDYWSSLNVFDEPWEEEEEEDEDVEELWEEGQDDENMENPEPTKVRHVPIDNDDFVERAQKIRKKKGVRPKTMGAQAKRLRMLEDGLMGLQSQFQQLAQVISRQVNPLAETMTHTPLTAALKGAIPWPEGLVLPDRVHPKAKGDGNCLWHSVAATLDNDEGRPIGDEGGLGLKRDTLAHLRSNAPQWAAVWQCQENGVTNAAEEWETQWADARACLTLSKLRDLTVIVFNRRDQLIETICAGQTPPFRGRVAILDYSGDHYDPLPTINPSDLQKIAQATNLTPWRHDPNNRREGGFVLRAGRPSLVPGRTSTYMRLQRVRWTKTKKQRTDQDPSLACPQESDMVTVTTWNVGGLRANLHRVTAYLKSDMPDMLMIQECRVAKEHERGIRAELKSVGYECYFEQPTPWKRNARGQSRLDIGMIPGVMLIAKESHTIVQIPPLNNGAEEFVRKGRLQLFHLHAHGQKPWLFVNMYFPAGKTAEGMRLAMTKAIWEELNTRGTDRAILGGDWNQHPLEAELTRRLTTERLWTVPTLVDRTMSPQETTYVMDGHGTWIDSFLVGAGTQCQIPVQVVDNEAGTLHKRVTLNIPSEPRVNVPTLRYPPTLQKRDTPSHHDWTHTQRCLDDTLTRLNQEPTRAWIDNLWEVWIREFHGYVKTQMTSQRDPLLGDLGQTSVVYKGLSRTPGVSRPHLTSIEKCVQAVDRLRVLEPLKGKARTRQLDAASCLKEHLEVGEEQMQDMLERPTPIIVSGRRD